MPDTSHPRGPTAPAKSVDALLAQGDADFVRCAYVTLLGREADPDGLTAYVNQVRSGADKLDLIAALALSPEGRSRQIDLPELTSALAAHRQSSQSLWARLSRRLVRPAILPALEPLERTLRMVDNRLYRIEALVAGSHDDLSALREKIRRLSVGAPAAQHSIEPAGAGPILARSVPPRVNQIYRGLKRMLSMRTGSPN
jgi:hypothetical protein